MNRRRTWKARWQLCIIFSLFALMSNLTGIVIDHQHSLSGSVYFRLDDDVSLANTCINDRCRRISWWPFCRSICWRYFQVFSECIWVGRMHKFILSHLYLSV